MLIEGGCGLQLQKLDSEDDIHARHSRVRVSAQLMANQRNDNAVERVIGRVSLEPSVSSAGWDVKEA
ncbi:hypothetical protein [Nitrincola tapanii]|uniref:MgtC-like C-terminal domain-containing protein n=1 Tax=Nitrincola tapanii TaxID=1708751 RepID=A0A5A9VYJ2_9GAMM|nr:hypothetical protein [Nitrincola tapanii]KAA0873536.1 hypothetical protein E1H14_12945 [Nitrincola tapanii]